MFERNTAGEGFMSVILIWNTWPVARTGSFVHNRDSSTYCVFYPAVHMGFVNA